MRDITARIVGCDVSNADYMRQTARRGDRDYVISRSDLMRFFKCPHKWRAGASDEQTEATKWGSAVDAALFNQFAGNYGVLSDTYTDDKGTVKPWNANATVCRAEKAAIEKSGRVAVRRDYVEAVDQAVAIIRDDYEASCLMENARVQVMLLGTFKDDETGLSIPIKALVDIVPDINGRFKHCLSDLKTTRDASPENWSRTVFDRGWHVQAAMYLDMWEAATGEGRSDWNHLIQESEPPYEIGRRILSAAFVATGRTAYREALQAYAHCLKNNDWPGYDDRRAQITPGWTLTEPEAWMVTETMASMRAIETPMRRAEMLSELPS